MSLSSGRSLVYMHIVQACTPRRCVASEVQHKAHSVHPSCVQVVQGTGQGVYERQEWAAVAGVLHLALFSLAAPQGQGVCPVPGPEVVHVLGCVNRLCACAGSYPFSSVTGVLSGDAVPPTLLGWVRGNGCVLNRVVQV
jgi:hypothetical protein